MKNRNILGGIRFAVRNPQELQKYLKSRSTLWQLFQDSLARFGMPISENERILRSLKGQHAGQRCFVIGNGPSLRLEDLEKLKGEVSIASNRIYVAFPEVAWRPTYYTCIDTIYAERHWMELNDLDLFKLYPDYLKSYLSCSDPSKYRNKSIYFHAIPGRFNIEGVYNGKFSDDALRGFHVGPSVTIVNLQLAYYMGCAPIYLLGVDGNYKVSNKIVPHSLQGQVVICEGEQNHFHPNYRAPGESYVAPLPHEIEIGYLACREFLKAHDIQVFNASRQTCITAFDKINIDEVLG